MGGIKYTKLAFCWLCISAMSGFLLIISFMVPSNFETNGDSHPIYGKFSKNSLKRFKPCTYTKKLIMKNSAANDRFCFFFYEKFCPERILSIATVAKKNPRK